MDSEEISVGETDPIDETSEMDEALEAVEPREKPPWKAFVLTGLLASLFGAAGGGAGVYAGLKARAPAPVNQAAVDLTPLEAKITQLSNRLKTAETRLQKAADQPAPETETVDLSAIEARLDALEDAPRPEIDPGALSALQAAQEDGFEWPDVSKLERQIAAIETSVSAASDNELPEGFLDRLSALEKTAAATKELSGSTNQSRNLITKLEARLSALEKRPAPAPVVEHVSLLPFPKALLMEAVEDNREGSLIKKTLSRHIRVKDANDPLTLIEGIETDLSKGQLAPAIEKFERLPAPVQAAGQAWYDNVKASL